MDFTIIYIVEAQGTKKSDILYHAINMMGAARYDRDELREFQNTNGDNSHTLKKKLLSLSD